jgi:hypothetical protein
MIPISRGATSSSKLFPGSLTDSHADRTDGVHRQKGVMTRRTW